MAIWPLSNLMRWSNKSRLSKRCDTIITVFSSYLLKSFFKIFRSRLVSNPFNPSSINKMSKSWRALARAIRCRWPPEILNPSSSNKAL